MTGRQLQRSLDQSKLRQDMLNSARWVQSHEDSTGKLGAVGFCWGGGTTNFLAVTMGGSLQAAVPFYGAAPDAEEVHKIKAALLILGEHDQAAKAFVQSAETFQHLRREFPNEIPHVLGLANARTGHAQIMHELGNSDEAEAELRAVIHILEEPNIAKRISNEHRDYASRARLHITSCHRS